MLEGFNADTASELRKYGEDLKAEIVRLIERLKPSTFSEKTKKQF
jgi:hypothetical protein